MSRMACCPRCEAPLISTFAFSKAEFYCLECGGLYGFLQPVGKDLTPEIEERYQALKAEWDEHAGANLLTAGGWHRDCATCKSREDGPHMHHATPEELEAHDAALKWLDGRAAVGA